VDVWDSSAFDWQVKILNSVEQASFFEQRATQYSKGARS